MKALIAKGAEVNKRDAKGNTALHELAKVLKASNAEALKILLAAGARLDVLNLDGETALAVANKSSNMDGAKLIISAGTLTAKK
jgi:ankyrin repeat protein